MIISDNGKNFILVDRELSDLIVTLDQPLIKNQATNDGISWRLNLPCVSQYRGLFNFLINCAKNEILPILGESQTTDANSY